MNLAGARILVTGGAGFIGSFVVEKLVQVGGEVTVLDNLSSGRLDNLLSVQSDIEFCLGDMRDPNVVGQCVRDKDVIFHLAANADVPRSVEDPSYDFHVNAVGGFNLLHACLGCTIHRIVYVSSAAVYGPPEYVPVDEAHPCNPISPYGASKLTTEVLGFAYRHTHGLPFTALRIFNTFGPRQRHYVIHDLFRKLQKDPHRLQVMGSGDQIRDYCYVSDTTQALVSVAEDDKTEGEVYNISGGRSVCIRDLVKLILEVRGSRDAKVTYTGRSWAGDIVHLEAAISKSRSFGFAPRVTLEDGLVRFKEWIDGQ